MNLILTSLGGCVEGKRQSEFPYRCLETYRVSLHSTRHEMLPLQLHAMPCVLPIGKYWRTSGRDLSQIFYVITVKCLKKSAHLHEIRTAIFLKESPDIL
jgi:hypothetical protein